MTALKMVFSSAHRKPIPGSGVLDPLVRTNYANDPLGSALDPLWAPSGKHAGPGATIDVVEDPAGIKGHVQRYVVLSGSVLWGGDRCETMTSQIGGDEGARYQVRFGLYLPSNFYSDGGAWNSLWDMHYPNDGPAQSPLTGSIRNSNELWLRVLGGPVTQDGTMGSIRNEAHVATLTKGVWNDLGFDILQHESQGLMDVWVNGTKVTSWGYIPTISPNVPNSTYWKQGFYRPTNSPSGTQTMYFTDTLMWESASPYDMLNWTP